MTPGSLRRRRSSTVGLSVLALVVLLTVAAPPSPAAARRPWQPTPPSGPYTPRQVWQTRDNCVFAAGAMLIDKWTHGRLRVSQGRLRKSSGDDEGGATFRELARGTASSTGIRLRWSPAGGDPMTWWQLLDRLERHGGAVLFGEYGKLPAAYTRWAPRFARAAKDDHAVYVERYDRGNARVWLMDPLAGRGFRGEWIDVRALRRFARFDGDLVYAAATTVRRRSSTGPLTDQAYRLGAPVLGGSLIANATTQVQVPLTIVDGFPLPAPHRIVARWERLGDPLGELGRDDAVALPVGDGGAAVTASVVRPPEVVVSRSAGARATAAGFSFGLPAPDRPGRYRLTLGLVPDSLSTDAAARTLPPLEVRVDPPFAGSIAVTAPPTTRVGSVLPIELTVANTGTVDWRAAPATDERPGSRIEAGPGLPAVLAMSWRSAAGEEILADETEVPIAPGSSGHLALDLAAPPTAGAWSLQVDVVHPGGWSLAAAGLAPADVIVTVDPPGAEAGS